MPALRFPVQQYGSVGAGCSDLMSDLHSIATGSATYAPGSLRLLLVVRDQSQQLSPRVIGQPDLLSPIGPSRQLKAVRTESLLQCPPRRCGARRVSGRSAAIRPCSRRHLAAGLREWLGAKAFWSSSQQAFNRSDRALCRRATSRNASNNSILRSPHPLSNLSKNGSSAAAEWPVLSAARISSR